MEACKPAWCKNCSCHSLHDLDPTQWFRVEKSNSEILNKQQNYLWNICRTWKQQLSKVQTFPWSSFFCYIHTGHDQLHYYQCLRVLAQLSKMSLSLVKNSVQRTQDGLTGSLEPDVWEVDNMFSRHRQQFTGVYPPYTEVQSWFNCLKESTRGWKGINKCWVGKGFVGKHLAVSASLSLGWKCSTAWINGSTSTSHFELIFHKAGWSPLLKGLDMHCCKLV